MSVIAELSLPADGFELGRILTVEGPTSIALETVVPMGERPVPFFRIHDGVRADFEAAIRGHPSVNRLQEVDSHDGEALYALDWSVSADSFVETILATGGTFLAATGTAQMWHVEVRFPSHEAFSQFQERCSAADIPLEVVRIYNPTEPDAGPGFGLSAPQRKALTLAVQEGYYAIPRRTSTEALAETFGISDQALTERLRRGIVALTTTTLFLDETT